MVRVFLGQPHSDGPPGFLKGPSGPPIPVEVAYQPSTGPDKMPGHYKLGFNWDTSTYPDNYFDVNGMPLALTGLPGRPRDGRGQFWATADQMILRNGPKDDDGLILLATYVHDQSATTPFRDSSGPASSIAASGPGVRTIRSASAPPGTTSARD